MPSPRALRRPAVRGALVALLAAGALAAGSPASAVPGRDEVAAQREAHRLGADAAERREDVTTVRARLAALTEAAAAALEANQLAEQRWAQAEADHWEATELLDHARSDARDRRGDLGRWAAQVYRDGGDLGAQQRLVAVLQADSTDDLSQRLTIINHVGRLRGAESADADGAAATREDTAERARASAVAARRAAAHAEETKAEAGRVVAQQRAELATLDALLRRSEDAAEAAAGRAGRLREAREVAEQRAAAAAAAAAAQQAEAAAQQAAASAGSPGRPPSGTNQVTGMTGACAGEDVSVFPNGQIPAQALCPLWGAPGELLRADAAFAFERLSQAYAATFGRPVCVTDSYRTLASQVRLKASKGHMAARPGTSNHGWGTALDLCDGVNDFGTPQHEWMQQNAPGFGWFHPSWARQGGGKPEPWHWEFGG